MDEKNIGLLSDAIYKTNPDTPLEAVTEETFESAFQAVDKSQLDKKVYVGHGKDRSAW